MSRRTRLFVALIAVIGVLLVAAFSVAGCGPISARLNSMKIKGDWYQSTTGLKWTFTSDGKLVGPVGVGSSTPTTIPYKVVAGNKIEFSNGAKSWTVDIKKLTRQELVTHDPTSNQDGQFFRDLSKTDYAQTRSQVAAGALAAIKRFPGIEPKAKIVWVSTPPSGDIPAWPLWPTSSLARYKSFWDWNNVQPAGYDVQTSGSGLNASYGIVFRRSIPATDQLDTAYKTSGLIVEPGGPLIDVGYTKAMAQYPAGTFVYMNETLLYSLGDGYVLGLRNGPSEQYGFIPYTYKKR